MSPWSAGAEELRLELASIANAQEFIEGWEPESGGGQVLRKRPRLRPKSLSS